MDHSRAACVCVSTYLLANYFTACAKKESISWYWESEKNRGFVGKNPHRINKHLAVASRHRALFYVFFVQYQGIWIYGCSVSYYLQNTETSFRPLFLSIPALFMQREKIQVYGSFLLLISLMAWTKVLVRPCIRGKQVRVYDMHVRSWNRYDVTSLTPLKLNMPTLRLIGPTVLSPWLKH